MPKLLQIITCSRYNPFKSHKEKSPVLSLLLKCMWAFMCFHSLQCKTPSCIREATSTTPSLPHHLSKCSILSSLNACIYYLFHSGQKQSINHFAEYRIPWAVATFTNCWRFKANDGDFAPEPCQICFLHLSVDSQFLMVLVITVTVHTERREILLRVKLRLQKSS